MKQQNHSVSSNGNNKRFYRRQKTRNSRSQQSTQIKNQQNSGNCNQSTVDRDHINFPGNNRMTEHSNENNVTMPGSNHFSKGDRKETADIRREVAVLNDTHQRRQRQQVNRVVNQRTVRKDTITPQTKIILNRVNDDEEIVFPSSHAVTFNSGRSNQKSITLVLVL